MAGRRLISSLGRFLGGTALCLMLPASPAKGQEYFDWRDIDGKDYTTPIRSQSVDGLYYAGTCWAFAAVATLEAKLEICYDRPAWNPDLSEQHLVCDGTAGNSSYGWEYKALQFFLDVGIVTEAELPYTASDFSPDWPPAEGWQERVYRITAFEQISNLATTHVKEMLRTHGPLTASMYTPSDWIPRPDSAPPTGSFDPTGFGEDDPTGGVNHSVCVVGYKDDPTILNGGYWIIKNSWGVNYGDHGYYYIPYGVLEAHGRLYAITGQALAPVPEPTGMMMGLFLAILLRKQRRW